MLKQSRILIGAYKKLMKSSEFSQGRKNPFLNDAYIPAGRLIWSADGTLLQDVGDGEFIVLEGY